MDVVLLEIRVLAKDVIGTVASTKQTHDDADREAHATYARPPPHHGGVVGDAGKDV